MSCTPRKTSLLLQMLLFVLLGLAVSAFQRSTTPVVTSVFLHQSEKAKTSWTLSSYAHSFKPRAYSPKGLNSLNPSITATIGLLSAATIGNHVDQIVDSTGILATLSVAALQGNLNLVPSTHLLYDLCWTLFLPASLAFLLLGSSEETAIAKTEKNESSSVALMAGPFILGSVGSILGCLFARPRVSAAAAGCLCASYIGGSVNFFATARIVGGGGAELTAMATSDLVVMAVYFALLSAIWKWNSLRHLFGAGEATSVTPESITVEEAALGDDDGVDEGDGDKRWLERSTATIAVSMLVFAVVQVANRIEKLLAPIVPGTACGVIALLCTLWRRLLSSSQRSTTFLNFWKSKAQAVMASKLSGICFQLLFASIGITANLGQALESGPTCLLYSLNALLTHVGIVLVGSFLWKKLVSRQTQLQHVLIASNAAIGGPATAATFAGNLGLPKLTLAATIWGVVGYAIGTSIGVQLTHFLSP